MAEKSVAQEVRERVTSRLKEIRENIGPLVKEESELVQMAPGESVRFGHQEEKAQEEAPVPAPARAEAPAAAPRQRRKRKGGTRAEQALTFVKENPGSTATEIATALDLKPNYLYRVLGEMEKEGQIAKEGKAYSATA